MGGTCSEKARNLIRPSNELSQSNRNPSRELNSSARFALRPLLREIVLVRKTQESHLIEILCVLADKGVQFVVAGGAAMVLHGIRADDARSGYRRLPRIRRICAGSFRL